MKKILTSTLLLISIAPFSQSFATDTEQLIASSKKAIQGLGGELKHTLQTAMKTDGPVKSISVCQMEAPKISEGILEKKGISVTRTALNYRNPENKPDDWEKDVLENFEKRKAEGESIKTIEYSELIEHNGDKIFRYMKAIPTGEVCLKCHGDNIAPPLANKINELYPADKAKGFMLGDIRGAFSVIQPVK